jgi:hypothetical protein
MTWNVRHAIRLSVASAALAGFIVASSPLFAPEFAFVTAAEAVSGIRATKDLCFWEQLGWEELQPSEQKAWATLGWTAEMWEDESDAAIPPSEYKDWDELSETEQHALTDLGYTPETWETFDSNAC